MIIKMLLALNVHQNFKTKKSLKNKQNVKAISYIIYHISDHIILEDIKILVDNIFCPFLKQNLAILLVKNEMRIFFKNSITNKVCIHCLIIRFCFSFFLYLLFFTGLPSNSFVIKLLTLSHTALSI